MTCVVCETNAPKGVPIALPDRSIHRVMKAVRNTRRFFEGSRVAAYEGFAGQHSIRINAQWRVCFRWTDEGPCDVEIVDYH